MQVLPLLPFTCVHVTALDNSGTELGYGETVNRSGISENNIGAAVIRAMQNMSEVESPADIGMCIVRFSLDT